MANSLAPEATRAMASGDPAVVLAVTASPSEANSPSDMATTAGASPALIGRSKESPIARR